MGLAPIAAAFPRSQSRALTLLPIVVLVLAASTSPVLAVSAAGELFIDHLRTIQDQFHDRIPVYEDVSSAGNRFHTYAKVPGPAAAVSLDGSWTSTKHSGATAIRCQFEDVAGANFGGFYFLNGVLASNDTVPQANFGDVPDAGVDLTGVTRLTFWARGAVGGEEIEFFVAGVGREAASGVPFEPFPDSSPRHPAQGTRTILTNTWQQYSIEGLGALDLTYVLGGFAWVADDTHNPGGAVFYLDDLKYELTPAAQAARLEQPRVLASFVTLPVQPAPAGCAATPGYDLALPNTAFSYDNALGLLAFIAHGSSDSLRRARIIGDAFVYATSHDRSPAATGGAVRSAYAAGDVALPPGWSPHGVPRAAALPGYYCDAPLTFFETGQEALDTGNNAWVMIALLALYQSTGVQQYRDTAAPIGSFIRSQRQNAGNWQGFLGGRERFENDPQGTQPPLQRAWASGEHNLDVYVAATMMAKLPGNSTWSADAPHASVLVEALWDAGIGCYRAGTLDPETLNTVAGQLPLDVQALSVLALPTVLSSPPARLACPTAFHALTDQGFSGFDFNEDRDGVWFEGTAQMSVADSRAGDYLASHQLRGELVAAQQGPPFGNGKGIAAATKDALTTGFDFQYYNRLHVGATAWAFFAAEAYNPYTQRALPFFADSFESGDRSRWSASQP